MTDCGYITRARSVALEGVPLNGTLVAPVVGLKMGDTRWCFYLVSPVSYLVSFLPPDQRQECPAFVIIIDGGGAEAGKQGSVDW